MNPPWNDDILASMERDYRNHPDVADLIAGVRRVLALHQPHHVYLGDWDTVGGYVCKACGEPTESEPCATVRALNDPNGA